MIRKNVTTPSSRTNRYVERYPTSQTVCNTMSHILASPVKFMFCCLSHIYKLGVIYNINMAKCSLYRGAEKSLARPGRKEAREHGRDARDFNNIETQDVINFFFLKGKGPKEIHAILTETLACFLPGRAKDLSAPL